MYGELTDKETVARVEYALEHQQHDQFEILLYKKNSEYMWFSWRLFDYSMWEAFMYLANELNVTNSNEFITFFINLKFSFSNRF